MLASVFSTLFSAAIIAGIAYFVVLVNRNHQMQEDKKVRSKARELNREQVEAKVVETESESTAEAETTETVPNDSDDPCVAIPMQGGSPDAVSAEETAVVIEDGAEPASYLDTATTTPDYDHPTILRERPDWTPQLLDSEVPEEPVSFGEESEAMPDLQAQWEEYIRMADGNLIQVQSSNADDSSMTDEEEAQLRQLLVEAEGVAQQQDLPLRFH